MYRTKKLKKAIISCTLLAAVSGCGRQPSTTVESLEAQLTRQAQRAWPDDGVASMHIRSFGNTRDVQFGNTRDDCAINAGVEVVWAQKPSDSLTHSTEALLRLYRAADDYLVGSVKFDTEHVLNVILKFE